MQAVVRAALRRRLRLRPQGRHARRGGAEERDDLRAHRPEAVGNHRRVLVSELSGQSNIL